MNAVRHVLGPVFVMCESVTAVPHTSYLRLNLVWMPFGSRSSNLWVFQFGPTRVAALAKQIQMVSKPMNFIFYLIAVAHMFDVNISHAQR